MQSDIIVSLTSYSVRMKTVHKVIQSILDGSLKPYKIILTLYKDDSKYLTRELKSMNDSGLIDIIYCDEDIRPHKKYFYTMKKYKNNPIVTIDDDVIYSNDFLASLNDAYKKNKCIIAKRAKKVTRDENGNILPYKTWKLFCGESKPSFDYMPTGIGGVLYPPDAFKVDDSLKSDIYATITTDDVLLYSLAVKNNVKIKIIKSENSYIEMQDNEVRNIGLWCNENVRNNDISIKKYIK